MLPHQLFEHREGRGRTGIANRRPAELPSTGQVTHARGAAAAVRPVFSDDSNAPASVATGASSGPPGGRKGLVFPRTARPAHGPGLRPCAATIARRPARPHGTTLPAAGTPSPP